MKYFVWIKNLHGAPEPQIWYGKQTDGNGKAKETLAIKQKILDDERDFVESLLTK